MNPPIAKKIPKTFEHHGDIRQDDYYWLNEKTNPEVIAYLEAENSYFKDVMKPLEGITNEIYEAMVARIPESEKEVPVQHGPYFYYSREEKELQYPIFARKRAASRLELDNAEEEILLDQNLLATDEDYLSITAMEISDDHSKLAYLENRDGTDSYTLYIKDLKTGKLLEDVIPNVYIYNSVEWSTDGKYIFYITLNELQRSEKLWRHKIGTPVSEDILLFEEADVTFSLYISKSQSGQFIFVTSNSTTTTEVQIIDAANPLKTIQMFESRRKGIEYHIEHWENEWIICTNEDALNFKLLSCPLGDFTSKTPLVPYDENYFLEGIYPFKNQVYITGRANGLQQVWRLKGDRLVQLEWDEPIYSVRIKPAQSYDTHELLLGYQSLTTPDTVFSADMESGQRQPLQEAPVSGEYDRSQYVQEQVWAHASDGTKIPVLLHYKKGVKESGPAPLILSAYGSYGISSDPYFTAYRLPILDKGVIFATAQVRGGSELGRTWYFNGRMKQKKNTFTDFIAAADFLVKEGFTSKELIAGRGGSAGGLLIGAVANMAGDRFKVLVPAVPFVDVMTTMLDESIPLTTGEWDEWGNPKISEDYAYMRSYSPYDNVEGKAYPHMYITTGINDPRVGYWEPAKWTARLRELKTDNHTLVLKTNMGAGHFGASGRLKELMEVAECYGFILSKLTI